MKNSFPSFSFLVVLLFFFGEASAQNFSGRGSSMGSSVALGGFLKTLVVPNALPVGKLTSIYGYEVWDFTSAKKSIGGHNRASFCYSAMEFTQDLSLFDLAYGGEGAKIIPVGSCPKDITAVQGEDLTFTIAYDIGKGSKSIPVGVTFSYGFDLSNFTQKIRSHFSVNNPHNRSASERLLRLHKHLLKYVVKKNVRTILSPMQSLMVKLFLSTSLIGKEELKSLILAKDELDLISNIASQRVLSFNAELSDAFREISRDASFYSCKDYSKCEEIYVDFLTYSDAITSSLSDCHSISINAALQTSVGISLAPDLKVEVGFGYSVTMKDKSYTSNLGTSVLAAKEFAAHRFSKHSEACQEVHKVAPSNFADFLSLLGYGKKPKVTRR